MTPGLDPDGDGMMNWQEYLAGTNPQNRGSALRLEALADPAGVVLRFTAQAGKTYSLQFSDSLSPVFWQSSSNLGPFSVSQVVQTSRAFNNLWVAAMVPLDYARGSVSPCGQNANPISIGGRRRQKPVTRYLISWLMVGMVTLTGSSRPLVKPKS